jgi:nucleoid-associated protein YgaU
VQRSLWFGSGAAALLLAAAAFYGLRTNPEPHRATPTVPPLVATPSPAPTAQPGGAPAMPAAPDRTPSFDIVRIDPDGQAVIAGRAAPGDRVRVLDGDKPIGEVTADQRGEWVVVPTAPIAPGDRQLALEATRPNGADPVRSRDVVGLSVPAPATGNKGAVAVLLPEDAAKPAQALQLPLPAPGAGPLRLDTAEFDGNDRLALAGHADPGARLNVYAGNRPLGTATADGAGKWSLTAPRPATTGAFELRLDQLAADGTVAHRIAAPFAPPAGAVLAEGSNYVVKRGNSLWWIARRTLGQGVRYTAIYSANRKLIRDPNLIYPGQVFKLPRSSLARPAARRVLAEDPLQSPAMHLEPPRRLRDVAIAQFEDPVDVGIVAIELGMCRSGRIGGAAGLVTGGNGRWSSPARASSERDLVLARWQVSGGVTVG